MYDMYHDGDFSVYKPMIMYVSTDQDLKKKTSRINNVIKHLRESKTRS
jgi:hypothetical protein